MPRLTFWYDFASTYSYIAAHTVGPAAEKAGVDVVWRPFLLGAVFAPQGLTDPPPGHRRRADGATPGG